MVCEIFIFRHIDYVMNKPEKSIQDKVPFIWHGQEYEKVLIIQNHDLHAGFTALLIYVLNGIRKAKAMNAVPVIDFNAENTPYFYDAPSGKDVFTYFFEAISPFRLSQILKWEREGKIDKNQIQYIKPQEAAKDHLHDPDRLATFWAWEKPLDKVAWMNTKRTLGREYVRKYLKPKVSIQKKVSKYIDTYFKADFIIGVHIRGTDFAYAQPTLFKTYLQKIDELLSKIKPVDYQIFVATDQEQYLENFKEHYGEKILSWNAIRSVNHIAPFRFDNVSGYQKGEDVLIDMLLLSRCHHMIKGAAAVGELALWFCDHNDITDFAIESDFNRVHYGKQESTFSRLNVDRKNITRLKLHKLRECLVRRLVASRVGMALYVRSALVRKVLKH